MTPPELVQHILSTHHELLRRELPRLSNALAVDGPDELASGFRQFEAYMMTHMAKEEQILFPSILELCRGGGAGCLRGAMIQMNYEHEVIEKLELGLRDLALGTRHETDIAALLDDLEVHAGLEDDVLFPAVRALIQPDQISPGLPATT